MRNALKKSHPNPFVQAASERSDAEGIVPCQSVADLNGIESTRLSDRQSPGEKKKFFFEMVRWSYAL